MWWSTFYVLSLALSSPFLHKKQGLMLCPTHAGLLKLAHGTLTLRIWAHFAKFSCICVALALFPAARSPGFRPASSAGNTTECTLCASHCPTPGMCWRRRVHTGSLTLLHSSLCQALMLTQLFLHTLLLQVCQLCKHSGDQASSGIIRNPDAGSTATPQTNE